MPVDAVILAGAPAGPEMSPEDETLSRAMVMIGTKTMLQWIVDALKSSKSIGRIIAVGDVSADGLDEVVEPCHSFLGNLMLGVDACGHNEPVLVLSSDIPMLTGEAIDDFVTRALATGGEMCYPIITKESCVEKYPDMKRTYLKTREGTFTGGNMLILSPAFMKRNEQRISDAYAARKKVFALARMIGFGVLIRAILAQALFPSVLPIPTLERAVSRMLGGHVAVIPTDYPEIGEDVDKASDLEAVRKIIPTN
jgi:GTP:adenosylcobinamide-phosphate guanylyltransferase